MRKVVFGLICIAVGVAVVYILWRWMQPTILFCSQQQGYQLMSSQALHDLVSKYKFNECKARSGGRVANSVTYKSDMQRCYQKAVLDFTLEERKAVTKIIKKHPRLAKRSWKFLKLADHMDWGYPFTLTDTIILPSKQIRHMTAETLMHEAIHIEQRMNPTLFDNLYEQEWGYRRAKHLKIPAAVAVNTVTNPDGPDDNWVRLVGDVWYWCSLVLQEDGSNPVGTAYRCLQTSLETFEVIDTGTPLTTLISSFNGETNSYHPNELYASLNSKL